MPTWLCTRKLTASRLSNALLDEDEETRSTKTSKVSSRMSSCRCQYLMLLHSLVTKMFITCRNKGCVWGGQES